MTPNLETLGEILRRHRVALDKTPEQIASLIEATPDRVTRFEADIEVPTAQEWNRYCTRVDRTLRPFGRQFEMMRQAVRDKHPKHRQLGTIGDIAAPHVIQRIIEPTISLAPVVAGPTITELFKSFEKAERSTFPAALRAARGALTMAAFGKRIGLSSQSTISRWESGDGVPSESTMAELVKVFPVLAPWRHLGKPPGNQAWLARGGNPVGSNGRKQRPRGDVAAALAIAVENSAQIDALPKAEQHRHDAYYTKHRGSDNHEDDDRPDAIETEAERVARDHTATTLRHMRAKRALAVAKDAADEAQRVLEAAKDEEASARKQLGYFVKKLQELA